jgi:hypothetical protein
MTLASTTIAATRLPAAVFADQFSSSRGTSGKGVPSANPICALKELL